MRLRPRAPGGDDSETSRRVIALRLDQIEPNPAQPRATIDRNEIENLAETMRHHGLLNPITVMDAAENYTLVAGQRRLLAARHLGWETIDALVVSGNAQELALIENIQRVDLHPIELADSLRKLVREKGWRHEDAAAAIGKARSTVSELLALADHLSDAVKGEWRASRVGSKSQLIALTSISDPDEQYRQWQDIKEGRTATVAETREQKRGAHSGVPVYRVLRSGWSFMNKLKQLEAADWSFDKKLWQDLQKLRREFNGYFKSLGRTSDAELSPESADAVTTAATTVSDSDPTPTT
jgi:ParB family transcriptional regulator, chromosome partitioning protein